MFKRLKRSKLALEIEIKKYTSKTFLEIQGDKKRSLEHGCPLISLIMLILNTFFTKMIFKRLKRLKFALEIEIDKYTSKSLFLS